MGYIQYGTNLDPKSEAFLQSVYDLDGEATTTEIHRRTGLNQDERNYRFEKLSRMDYIVVNYAEESVGKRHPPKVATLTDKGIQEVETGISEDGIEILADSEWETRFAGLENRIERLESRLNQQDDRIRTLERFKSRLRSTIFPEE